MGRITGSPSLLSLGSPSQAVRKARFGKWDKVRLEVIPRETESLNARTLQTTSPVTVPLKPRDRLLRERCAPHPELVSVQVRVVKGSETARTVGGTTARRDAIAKMAKRTLPWWERDRLEREKRRASDMKRKQRAANASVKRDRKRRAAERREVATYLQAKFSQDRELLNTTLALTNAEPWIVLGVDTEPSAEGWVGSILLGRGANRGEPETQTLKVRAQTEAQCKLLVKQRVNAIRNR